MTHGLVKPSTWTVGGFCHLFLTSRSWQRQCHITSLIMLRYIAKVKRFYRFDQALSAVDTKLTKWEINLVGLT